jgi:hypothetical protein
LFYSRTYGVFQPFCIFSFPLLCCYLSSNPFCWNYCSGFSFLLRYFVIHFNLFFCCLYFFLHIPFLSLLFPTYAGFVTPSFGFLRSLTFTLCRLPILHSTIHSDQLFPLLALSVHPNYTKAKFWREEDNWSRCRESNTDCLLSVVTVAVSTHVTCTVDYERVTMIYHVCWLTLSRQFCLTWLRLITGSQLP